MICGCCWSPAHAGTKIPPSRRRIIGAALATGVSIFASEARAQVEHWRGGLEGKCNFFPDQNFDAEIYTFGSSGEAFTIVRRITDAVGLPPNFIVRQANVPNAAAAIQGSQRFVLYSEVFIRNIIERSATEWAAWTILAHEVGHHLSGHTLLLTGSRPPIELEADRFAGFAVARMGGTLQQALSPFQQMNPEGSATHPPRSARLEAVAAGYRQADLNRDSGGTRTTNDQPSPTSPRWLGKEFTLNDRSCRLAELNEGGRVRQRIACETSAGSRAFIWQN